ncbi:hypothetical protein F751_5042 [Auxenochlorella protothecoides]|uniref:Uncharacterized protein n=1 Tax=Auxenochlorella protothecoides TaxID=3075 RepID=A0A087SEP6_AUXPR|nr:hypothetical protein F751_5042 [Auxenochlorella protothecoides]KFM24200.1 hypothetical protein F751_5042 [Auxenochlorella protothecoides]
MPTAPCRLAHGRTEGEAFPIVPVRGSATINSSLAHLMQLLVYLTAERAC